MVIRQEASAHERDQTLTPHALKARIVGTPGENITDRFWKKERIVPLTWYSSGVINVLVESEDVV